MTNDVDCFVIGLGIKSYLQLTREAEQALSASKEVHYLHSDPTVASYLESRVPIARSLEDCYNEGEPRQLAYRRMFGRVIEAILNSTPVAVAIYGNPAVLVNLTWALDEWACENNRIIDVLPGVSALDCMLVDLGIDPAEGMLSYEANDLLIHKKPLIPDIHLFLWQIGSVESELFSWGESKPERFLGITDFLLKAYPPEHEVIAVSCASSPIVASSVKSVPLKQLPTLSRYLDYSATLYIPPLRCTRERSVYHRELLHSRKHLDRILKTVS